MVGGYTGIRFKCLYFPYSKILLNVLMLVIILLPHVQTISDSMEKQAEAELSYSYYRLLWFTASFYGSNISAQV